MSGVPFGYWEKRSMSTDSEDTVVNRRGFNRIGCTNRGSVSVLSLISLVTAMLEAVPAEAKPYSTDAHQGAACIQDRIDAIRRRLQRDNTCPSPDSLPELTVVGQWGNWPNWSNWRNW